MNKVKEEAERLVELFFNEFTKNFTENELSKKLAELSYRDKSKQHALICVNEIIKSFGKCQINIIDENGFLVGETKEIQRLEEIKQEIQKL